MTVIEMGDRLIAREDEDISSTLQKVLEAEGIAFRLSAAGKEVRRTPSGIVVAVEDARGASEVSGSHLLVATGRRPNTDDLGLAAAGIAAGSQGFITVDDQCRTNVPGVWALGRMQRPGRLHPYRLQRLRDRGREPVR